MTMTMTARENAIDEGECLDGCLLYSGNEEDDEVSVMYIMYNIIYHLYVVWMLFACSLVKAENMGVKALINGDR